jgi:uncharacterized protein (DUF2062 family)
LTPGAVEERAGVVGALRAWGRRIGAVLRERFVTALREDRPWRVALALSVGVFISFTPFYGLQTIMALLVATLLRLNRAITVTGTWMNLPWFAPFIYAGAIKLGTLLLPNLHGWSGISVALLVGTTILGIGAAAVTYVVALAVIARRRAHSAAARARRRAA